MAVQTTDLPSLGDDEFDAIKRVLATWSRLHPEPDVPILDLIDGGSLTPRDIAEALDHPHGPRGRSVQAMFALLLRGHFTDPVPLEAVVAPFESDVRHWREAGA
jgi:hypothetical protein